MLRLLAKREKIIFFIAAGVIILSISFNFLIEPLLKKNEMLNKKINMAKTKLNKYRWLLNQREYLQDKYNKLFLKAKEYSAGKDTLVGALSELENLAKNANIRIIDIRPQVSKGSIAGSGEEIIIDLRLEGTMEGYLKFIYDLENSLLLFRIKRFQLNTRPGTSGLEGTFSVLQPSALD